MSKHAGETVEALVERARAVLDWWPSYTGLPMRVRESEDPTEYLDGRKLLAQNDVALAALTTITARAQETERERDAALEAERLIHERCDEAEVEWGTAETALREAREALRRIGDLLFGEWDNAATHWDRLRVAEAIIRRALAQPASKPWLICPHCGQNPATMARVMSEATDAVAAYSKYLEDCCRTDLDPREAQLRVAREGLEHYAERDHWTEDTPPEEINMAGYTLWGYDGGHEEPWTIASDTLARLDAPKQAVSGSGGEGT